MKKRLLCSSIIFLMIILLCNRTSFAIESIETNKKVVWIDVYGDNSGHGRRSYEDAYKIYKTNNEEDLDKRIKYLEKKLEGIFITYKGEKMHKYIPRCQYVSDDYSRAFVSRWEFLNGMGGLDWEYRTYIEGTLTTTKTNYTGFSQSNEIPVDVNKMLKAYYVLIMERVLESENIQK